MLNNKEDNRNMLLAIVLSGIVLIGWNWFYGVPEMQKQRQAAQTAPAATQGTAPQPNVRRVPQRQRGGCGPARDTGRRGGGGAEPGAGAGRLAARHHRHAEDPRLAVADRRTPR